MEDGREMRERRLIETRFKLPESGRWVFFVHESSLDRWNFGQFMGERFWSVIYLHKNHHFSKIRYWCYAYPPNLTG